MSSITYKNCFDKVRSDYDNNRHYRIDDSILKAENDLKLSYHAMFKPWAEYSDKKKYLDVLMKFSKNPTDVNHDKAIEFILDHLLFNDIIDDWRQYDDPPQTPYYCEQVFCVDDNCINYPCYNLLHQQS